jgi:histone H3/H4
MRAPSHPSVVDRAGFLRMLAVDEFVQMVVLLALGLATVRLIRSESAASFALRVQDMSVGPLQRIAERFLARWHMRLVALATEAGTAAIA